MRTRISEIPHERRNTRDGADIVAEIRSLNPAKFLVSKCGCEPLPNRMRSYADRIEAAMAQEHSERTQTVVDEAGDSAGTECTACDAAGCVTHAAPSYRVLRNELVRVASEIGRVRVTGVDDTTDCAVSGLLRQARLSLSDAVEFVERMMRAKENEP